MLDCFGASSEVAVVAKMAHALLAGEFLLASTDFWFVLGSAWLNFQHGAFDAGTDSLQSVQHAMATRREGWEYLHYWWWEFFPIALATESAARVSGSDELEDCEPERWFLEEQIDPERYRDRCMTELVKRHVRQGLHHLRSQDWDAARPEFVACIDWAINRRDGPTLLGIAVVLARQD